MVSLSIIQIVVSSKLSTDGITLDKINASLQNYETENAVLREKVYEASSLTHIASQAASMGFVENEVPISLSGPLPLAVK